MPSLSGQTGADDLQVLLERDDVAAHARVARAGLHQHRLVAGGVAAVRQRGEPGQDLGLAVEQPEPVAERPGQLADVNIERAAVGRCGPVELGALHNHRCVREQQVVLHVVVVQVGVHDQVDVGCGDPRRAKPGRQQRRAVAVDPQSGRTRADVVGPAVDQHDPAAVRRQVAVARRGDQRVGGRVGQVRDERDVGDHPDLDDAQLPAHRGQVCAVSSMPPSTNSIAPVM